MMPDEIEEFREWTRRMCFGLARIGLILAVTILITEYLFPSKDRSWVVIGPAIGLTCSSVFAMVMTRKKRT